MTRMHLRTPEELVTFVLHGEKTDPKYDLATIIHRQNLVKLWRISRGATVLDIGCGQWWFTVVAADAVGPQGRVVGLDSAPPDFGTPPIGPAQEYMKKSPVGPQIDFVRMDVVEYLEATPLAFDYIVFAHAVWYFSEPAVLRKTLEAAKTRARTVLIAEFALAAPQPALLPLFLTALAVNTLESMRNTKTRRNIRCALSSAQMISISASSGWALRSAAIVTPPKESRFGLWEVIQVLEWPNFVNDVQQLDASEREKSMLLGMRDAVATSVKILLGGKDTIVDMDTWAGRFEEEGGEEDVVWISDFLQVS